MSLEFPIWERYEIAKCVYSGAKSTIEVEQLPSELIKGKDPQLQKAIEVALKELGQKPQAEILRPAYPVKVHH